MNGDSSGNPFGAPGDIRILRRDYGDYMYGVARSALITTLRDALPAEILNFGYDITGIKDGNESMDKIFIKGTFGAERKEIEEGPFDVVIAADGINSALRSAIYGKKVLATYSGMNMFYGIADLGDIDKNTFQYHDHSLVQHYGRGQSFIFYGLGPVLPSAASNFPAAPHPTYADDVFGAPSQVVWALAYRSNTPVPESWDGSATRAALDAVVAEGQWLDNRPLRALAAATRCEGTAARPSALAHFGLFYRPPVAPWSRGGLVLLGDAAQATLPHLGQVRGNSHSSPRCSPSPHCPMRGSPSLCQKPTHARTGGGEI